MREFRLWLNLQCMIARELVAIALFWLACKIAKQDEAEDAE